MPGRRVWQPGPAAPGRDQVSGDIGLSGGRRAGRNDGYVGEGDFAAFAVEVADVHRAVGASHPAEHAGTLGAGQVLVAPLLQRAEDHLELLAGRGEPVRETGPGAGLAVRLTS